MDKKITLFDKVIIYGGYIAVLLTACIFAIITPTFLRGDNILNIIVQSSILGIVAAGMTTILIAGGTHVIKGGIDLSLASNMAFSVAVIALLVQDGMGLFLAFLIGMVCNIVIGLINAVSVAKFKVTPLLSTLSIMYILDGLIIAITKNSVVGINNDALSTIAQGDFLGVPIIAWVFLLVVAALYFLCDMTSYGNKMYACGGNAVAAETAGIKVERVVMSSYVIAGITAGISGLLMAARLSGSVPGTAGNMFLDVMLIAYMSAIFSKKAVPCILGAMISALFVGMLSNGLTLIGVVSYWVYAVKGILILVSVSLTSFRTKAGS